MTVHEQVAEVTSGMEQAVYAAMDAVDAYVDTIRRLLAEQGALEEPNEMLVKRFKQFINRGETMTTMLEDDVLTEMLFCVHRLFAVDLAEKGEFI